MGGFRIHGLRGLQNIHLRPGYLQVQGGLNAVPGTTGLMTTDELLLHALDAGSETEASGQFNRLVGDLATAVSFNELMRGVLGVYGADHRPLDTRTFDWLSPFGVKGIWTLRPETINGENRQIRDRVQRILRTTRLPHAISGMMRATMTDQRERGAVLLPNGRTGRVIRGHRNQVSFRPRDNVRVIGEVHTHPPSEILAIPSYPDDFRRNGSIVLVAESSSGRLWLAFWPRYILLLGRISGQQFQPVSTADRHFDTVFSVSYG